MKYGGVPCDKTSEAKACNAQACEKDCTLSEWTMWSTCSKDCDGGTAKREKFIKEEPLGDGQCPDQWSGKRLQYKQCNMNRCQIASKEVPLSCNKSVDVILLIDGSGSLGATGWSTEIKAARLFVDAFTQTGISGDAPHANMAVILFSGPRTWSGVKKCVGKSDGSVDIENFCNIKTVTHFTEDLKKVKQLVTGLSWPQGSTLTSLALMTAKAELAMGRPTAPSSVVVFTDGRPLSYRNTYVASRKLRKSARLLWVPILEYAPSILKFIKACATRRWQENVVPVKTFKQLEDDGATVITHIIADMCPKEEQKLRMATAQGGTR